MIDSARPQSRGTVMVVEDDPQAARLVQKLLRADGFSVTVVDDGPAALARVAESPPDLVSTRPYRPARSLDEARSELTGDVRDGRFAAHLVEEFLNLVDTGVVRPGQSE